MRFVRGLTFAAGYVGSYPTRETIRKVRHMTFGEWKKINHKHIKLAYALWKKKGCPTDWVAIEQIWQETEESIQDSVA